MYIALAVGLHFFRVKVEYTNLKRKNKTFMNEVLAFPRKNPNVYFMDKYTDKELNILPDIDIMLKENTLFGVFSALIPYEDRDKAYRLLLEQNGNYYRYLHLPVGKVRC